MSDRGIFVASFLTVVLIVAGAFAVPEYYPFELLRSLIFVAITLMVFFGENKYSYMLGVVAPVMLMLLNILLGGFFGEFAVLWASVTMQPLPTLETPLHSLAILTMILLVILSVRAWRSEVTEKFFGKTFWVCLGIAAANVAVLTGWYVWGAAERGRLP
jgi:hypothetical protein